MSKRGLDEYDAKHPDSRENQPRAQRSKKKTSKWCKGVKGVEHDTEIVIPSNAIRQVCDPTKYDGDNWFSIYAWEIGCYHVVQCIKCGKHVKDYLSKGECPDREAK